MLVYYVILCPGFYICTINFFYLDTYGIAGLANMKRI